MAGRQNQLLSRVGVLILVTAFLSPLAAVRNAGAYATEDRWGQSTYSVSYSVASTIDDVILPGQLSAITSQIEAAAFTWNISSNFKLNRTGAANAWNAQNLGSCAGGNVLFAVTTQGLTGGFLVTASTNFNSNSCLVWNTTGSFAPRTDGKYNADIQKVARHEFGHWLSLGHPNITYPIGSDPQTRSVMHIPGMKALSVPSIDDKLGINMLYGMSSSFEVSQFLGTSPNLAPSPRNGVGAYNTCSSSTFPTYWTFNPPDGSNNVPAGNGGTAGRYTKYQGCALNSSSPNYAYMEFYSAFSDGPSDLQASCGSQCYQKIQSGMDLRWIQYNGSQCTATLDIEFTDGTFLRDKKVGGMPYTDTAGVSVHPADRHCSVYGQGYWFYVEINLNPFVGKTVKRVMLAYDNSNNTSVKGNWRVYFDAVTLGH